MLDILTNLEKAKEPLFINVSNEITRSDGSGSYSGNSYLFNLLFLLFNSLEAGVCFDYYSLRWKLNKVVLSLSQSLKRSL